MDKTLREQLFELADEDYQKFSSALIPNIDNVLGVRVPELRKLAIEISRGDWRGYLTQPPEHKYFEEMMIHGMVIGYLKTDIDEILRYTADFVPAINNWSVCDSFCSGLKITKKNPHKVWEFLQPYLLSDHEYEIRFAVVMLLNYFIDEAYLPLVLERLDQVKHDGYYVKMAVAWAVSMCFVKLPEPTWAYLKQNNLDDFTFHKSLQKITESLRVDQETKQMIRRLKRKPVKQ